MTGIIAFPLFPYLQIRSKILVCLIYKVIRQEKDASRMHRINDMIHESQSLSVFFLPSGIGHPPASSPRRQGLFTATAATRTSTTPSPTATWSTHHITSSQDGRRHLPHLNLLAIENRKYILTISQVRTYNKTTSCRLVESSGCFDEMTLSLFKF